MVARARSTEGDMDMVDMVDMADMADMADTMVSTLFPIIW